MALHDGRGIGQSRRLARRAILAVKQLQAAGVLAGVAVDDVARAIGRAVVDRHDGEAIAGVVHVEQGFDAAGDHALFVVRCNKNGDVRPVGLFNARVNGALAAKQAVDGEHVVAHGVQRLQHHNAGQNTQAQGQ